MINYLHAAPRSSAFAPDGPLRRGLSGSLRTTELGREPANDESRTNLPHARRSFAPSCGTAQGNFREIPALLGLQSLLPRQLQAGRKGAGQRDP